MLLHLRSFQAKQLCKSFWPLGEGAEGGNTRGASGPSATSVSVEEPGTTPAAPVGEEGTSPLSSPPSGPQLFTSINLMSLPRVAWMFKAPGRDSCVGVCRSNTSGSPAASGPGEGNLLLLRGRGRWMCCLGLDSLAKGATLLWHWMLLWRTKPGALPGL